MLSTTNGGQISACLMAKECTHRTQGMKKEFCKCIQIHSRAINGKKQCGKPQGKCALGEVQY